MIEYNIWFDVCAIIMSSAMILLHFLRRNISIFQTKILVMLLFSIWTASVASFFTIYLEGKCYWPLVVANYMTILGDLAFGAFWMVYLMASVNFRVHLKSVLLPLAVPVSIGLGLMIANAFTHCIFLIDETLHFKTGPLMILLYGVYVFFITYGVGFFVRSRRHLSTEKFFLLPLMVFIAALGIIVEAIWPEMIVQQISLVYCIIIIYFTAQNPDEFFDDDTGVMNERAFISLCSGRLIKGNRLDCIAVCVHDVELARKYILSDHQHTIEKNILRNLDEYSRSMLIFRMHEGHYLAVMDRDDAAYCDAAFEQVKNLFGNLYVGGEYKVRISSTCCRFECPLHASTLDGIKYLLAKVSEVGIQKELDVVMPDDLNLPQEIYLNKINSLVKTAIAEKRLEVYFQPIYSTAEKKFSSAEALLRMRDELGNFVPPDVFIVEAEKNGSIIDIGSFVLDEVCRAFAENDLALYGVKYIEVNLSVIEGMQTNLVKKVSHTLEKYGVEPGCINLEVTETGAGAVNSALDENLRQLHEMGIAFSLDDFGTGYSSLARILSMPLDIIKLDKSIIIPAFSDDEKSRTLLECSVDMVKRIGTKIVAEGVETLEMVNGITELGCDYIQGFYYSKPLPKEDFIKFIKENARQG